MKSQWDTWQADGCSVSLYQRQSGRMKLPLNASPSLVSQSRPSSGDPFTGLGGLPPPSNIHHLVTSVHLSVGETLTWLFRNTKSRDGTCHAALSRTPSPLEMWVSRRTPSWRSPRSFSPVQVPCCGSESCIWGSAKPWRLPWADKIPGWNPGIGFFWWKISCLDHSSFWDQIR